MFQRLHAYLFGKKNQDVARDLSFFPVVGSSSTNADTTVMWSSQDAGADLDRTVRAPSPDVAHPSRDATAETCERQRLAWPARDASRAPRGTTAQAQPDIVSPVVKVCRPAEDMTVVVTRKPRSRQSPV